MTRRTLLPVPVLKEARALMFPWLACMAAIAIPALVQSSRLTGGIAAPVYFLGAAALGALSIGQEYTGGTVGLLLSLPVRRRRILLTKLGVLGAMLTALSLAAWALIFHTGTAHESERLAATVLPLLCGLFVAPWLTMACRNPIGGTVFTVGIPGALAVAGELLGRARFGGGSEMEAFRMTFLSRGTLALCALGAVAGWWTFMRLEAIEGGGQPLSFPLALRKAVGARTTASSSRRHSSLWLLAKKELHLQQMTFAITGLYVVGWLAAVALRTRVANLDDAVTLLTLSFAGLIALLSGASASAGERQLGTLEWQMLLPMAAWKQWTVKVTLVLGLVMVLAFGVPAALAWETPALGPKQFFRPDLAAPLLVLATVSLYVSSLCTTGLWALVMSLPAAFMTVLFVRHLADSLGPAAYEVWRRVFNTILPSRPALGRLVTTRLSSTLMLLLAAGAIAIAMRFAFRNHRSGERSAGRVCSQVAVIAAFVGGGALLIAGVMAFSG
jgi:hypothetical protein